MNTPPVGPTSPTSQPPSDESLSPSQQAQQDLSAISAINSQIEKALAVGASPAQIQALMRKLQQPLRDLAKLAPELPQSVNHMIDNAEQQYQFFSHRVEAITPSAIALFQGTCITAAQVIGAPSGATINVQALQDQNQLSQLAIALQFQMQAHGGSQNQACEDIVNHMQGPLKNLQQLAQLGKLTPDQSHQVADITEFYNDNLQKYETTNPTTVGHFQTLLTDLGDLLLNR
jgi:exonuclease VII large subunit